METALLLAGKITELTLIVLMGMALVKSKLLTSEHSRTLSVIALYLISPSVMIHAFQIENTPDIIDGLKLSVALAVVFHILLIALGRLFKTGSSSIRSNTPPRFTPIPAISSSRW